MTEMREQIARHLMAERAEQSFGYMWDNAHEYLRDRFRLKADAILALPALSAAQAEVDRLREENRKLRIAFHDAIRRPMGVTPDSGAEFFDQRMVEEAERRRAALSSTGQRP